MKKDNFLIRFILHDLKVLIFVFTSRLTADEFSFLEENLYVVFVSKLTFLLIGNIKKDQISQDSISFSFVFLIDYRFEWFG